MQTPAAAAANTTDDTATTTNPGPPSSEAPPPALDPKVLEMIEDAKETGWNTFRWRANKCLRPETIKRARALLDDPGVVPLLAHIFSCDPEETDVREALNRFREPFAFLDLGLQGALVGNLMRYPTFILRDVLIPAWEQV